MFCSCEEKVRSFRPKVKTLPSQIKHIVDYFGMVGTVASKANPSEMEQIAGVFWGENSSKNEQLEFQSHPFGKGKTTLFKMCKFFWGG